MKQETLEEAAERLFGKNFNGMHYDDINDKHIINYGLALAKWQQERMYSEKDMKSAFKTGFSIGYGSPVNGLDSKDETCDVWFEQFKNK
jgi:hypothetical protein